MEEGINMSLKNLNVGLLANSLQTGKNLGILDRLVKGLMDDLSDIVESESFD
jgi:hypothetical protein